jgi:hypothetical protein
MTDSFLIYMLCTNRKHEIVAVSIYRIGKTTSSLLQHVQNKKIHKKTHPQIFALLKKL